MTKLEWIIEYNSKKSAFEMVLHDIFDNLENIRMIDIIRYNYLRGQLTIIIDALNDQKLIDEYTSFVKINKLDVLDNLIYQEIFNIHINLNQ